MDTPTESFPSKSYALSGKIMLTCIVVLLTVMLLMALLHLYARWYLRRVVERRVSNRRHGNSHRRMNIVIYASPDTPSAPRGLDHSVLASLPVIQYTAESSPKSPSSYPSPLQECAVCLSEFNEGEKVRLLPKCNHSFHLDCIDMWFYSHATCPLCRSSVEKFNSTTSLGARRKEFGNGRVRIEVPRTQFEAELVASSPASYRSPMGRLRSLTRILSMGRRPAVNSPKDRAGPSFDNSAQLDLESGLSELAREQSRVHTPR